jgi:hypothetical protein
LYRKPSRARILCANLTYSNELYVPVPSGAKLWLPSTYEVLTKWKNITNPAESTSAAAIREYTYNSSYTLLGATPSSTYYPYDAWVRSPNSSYTNRAWNVYDTGSVYSNGAYNYVTYARALRPALNLNF